MKTKIKLIVGFRRDQEYSIDAEESHKAYYLFLHPEARTIFSNGLAILGSDIKEIVPDYHGTMGWNATHVLDNDDWNEINRMGLSKKIQRMLAAGKEIAQLGDAQDLNVSLTELVKNKYLGIKYGSSLRLGGMNSIGDMLKK